MKTLLVPIDYSPVTKVVVAQAVALARACGGRIVLLHVLQPPVLAANYGGTLEPFIPFLARAAKTSMRLMADWKKTVAAAGIPVSEIQVQGYAVDEIVQQIGQVSADLVVMGSHGHSAVYDLLIGGTTTGVLHRSPAPVVVVPTRPRGAKSRKR
jgi:nucleotide-binding universal stress UspA family protein